jgi:hypothetical protein
MFDDRSSLWRLQQSNKLCIIVFPPNCRFVSAKDLAKTKPDASCRPIGKTSQCLNSMYKMSNSPATCAASISKMAELPILLFQIAALRSLRALLRLSPDRIITLLHAAIRGGKIPRAQIHARH